MSREVGFYDKATGVVKWFSADRLKDYAAERRNNPVAPMIIQDTIDWMKHPGDGRYYDSRSSFEHVSKAMGLAQCSIPDDFNYNRNTMIRDLSKEEVAAIGEDIEQAAHRTYHALRDGAQKMTDDQKDYAAAVNESYTDVTGKTADVK